MDDLEIRRRGAISGVKDGRTGHRGQGVGEAVSVFEPGLMPPLSEPSPGVGCHLRLLTLNSHTSISPARKSLSTTAPPNGPKRVSMTMPSSTSVAADIRR